MKGIKLASVVGLLILSLISGCTKIDTTDLGNELIPAVDNVNTFLTSLDVKTDNKLMTDDDSIRMLRGEDHAIGIIENDPEFGKTVATSYIAFTPTASRAYPFVKRDTVIIDSVVLSLNYTQTFGDTNAIQQFEVREIDTRFMKFEDSLYLISAPDFQVNNTVIGSSMVHFNRLNDSAIYRNGKDTVRKTNELRIQLDTAWARRFVNYDTSNAYKNDSSFLLAFGGLQVKPVEGQGSGTALGYFSLEDNERTRITFYCRVQTNGRTDTIAPYFAHTRDPMANLIRRTPANAYQAALTNTTPNDELLYVQSSPGSYVEVELAGLDTVADRNRIVHRAELVFERYPAQNLFYGAPPLMFIDAISVTGDSTLTIRNDFVSTQAEPGYSVELLGGQLRNDQYVFNLTRYVQSIVTKKLQMHKLRVYAPFYATPYQLGQNSDIAFANIAVFVNTPIAWGRTVLYGGGSADVKRPKLRIIYSLL